MPRPLEIAAARRIERLHGVCGVSAVAKLFGTERNAPPHFAGRQDELGKLASYADYVFRNADPSGGIALIDGVPGSGKTQLMREFVERQQRDRGGVLTLAVTTADIPEDAKSLMFLIASTMPVGRRKALGIVGEERRARALSLAGIDRFDWDNPTPPDLPITEMLRLSKDTGWWNDQSMIVSIDEIQTLEPPARKMLRVLHEGLHGCPIMVVCAGLTQSARMLADPNDGPHTISRCALRLSLGLLSAAEAQEAILQGLANLGVECPRGVGEQLAAASMGFPQHVYGYLAGAMAASEIANPADPSFLSAALAHGDDIRRQYYEARLSSLRAPKGIVYFLAGAMDEAGEGRALYLHELVEALERLPPGYNPDELPATTVIDSAVAAGVLVEEEERYSFGIPSFHEYALAAYRAMVACEHMRRRPSRFAGPSARLRPSGQLSASPFCVGELARPAAKPAALATNSRTRSG